MIILECKNFMSILYDIEIGLGLLVTCLKDTVQTDKL